MTDAAVPENLPPKLKEIVEIFQEAQGQDKLEVLLEFALELPDMPPRLQAQTGAVETVDECQTPFSLASEIRDGKITFYYEVPRESPTVRGFASILAQGLAGASAEEVLAVPADIYVYLGLDRVMSPLRLRGMQATLNRMKRRAREYLANPA